MKTIKYFVLSLVAGLGMASCANEYEYQPAPQDADEDRAQVSFAKATQSIEADPNGATAQVVTINRANKEGKCEVNFDVLENTDDALSFTTPIFEDGDSTTTFTVDYSKCEIGKSYTLKLQVTNPELVSQYDNGTTYTFNVVRIKWNSLGMASMYEDFILEFEREVEIQQRDDKPSMYRLVHPFANIGGLEEKQEYIEFQVLSPNDMVYDTKITSKDLVYFKRINMGYYHSTYGDYIWAFHPLEFTSKTEEDCKHNKVLSWQEPTTGENGNEVRLPGQVQFAPYYYIPGVGGWDYTQADGMFVITFPGFIPQYEANIETDFDFDEELTSDYESAFLKSKHQTTLYRGTCVVTTDSCDKRFAEQYGTLYILEAPYAEGYDFKFLVKKGKVSVPEGYEVQATGLVALNQDVYAVINDGTYDEETKTLNLNISFVNKTGTVEYGTSDESMKMEKWNDLGKGIMQDDIIIPLYGEDPIAYDVQFEEKDSEPGIIRVVNPFGPDNYPYYNALINDAGCTMPEEGKTLVINCVDPDGVYIEKQSLNLDLGDGEIEFISLGADFLEQGYPFAQVKAAGYFGKYDKTTGMITFKTVTSSSGRDFQAYLYEAGQLAYYAGMNGGIAFKVPTAAAARMETIKATPSVSNLKKHETRTKIAKPFISGAKKTASKYTVRKSGKAPKAQFSPKRMKKMDASAAIR